jgi:hypothetical protein
MTFRVPERYRTSAFGPTPTKSGQTFGAFFIPQRPGDPPLRVIAIDGNVPFTGPRWEHVSVSLPHRCPTWAEMCKVKELFWEPEDMVVQFHPPASAHVNCHPYCLHLWRAVDEHQPAPPQHFV